ncbi:hypothetical protein CAEBREN_19209 [Caenorhabditis brenneri]|uniref:F-box domain-containing protein n=1 Tax=Caenorhabditis brenneri TaxID=135651 RepID=G0NIB9_CAEBE|nr:hypothetical protein CAEBREN_19209 [Caenorhabditis brenneri]
MNAAHPSLTGVPPETLNKIFKTLDYKEILRLRLVSRHLKNYVDTCRPDFHHKYIFVNVITNGYFVFFGNDVKELERKNHMKKVMSIAGDEDEWKVLETVLGHQKSPLEVLQISCEWEENEKTFVRVLEKIRNILASQNRTLQVKSLKIHVLNEDHLMRVLPSLDPASLKEIHLEDMLPLTLRREKKFIEIGRMKESVHWQKVNEFYAMNFLMNAPQFDDFDHFRTVRIGMDTLKMSDVVMLKEKLFVSPIHKFISINYRNLVEDVEIPEGHRPFPGADLYEYRIPNQDKHVRLDFMDGQVSIGIQETVHIGGEDIPVRAMDLDFDDEW